MKHCTGGSYLFCIYNYSFDIKTRWQILIYFFTEIRVIFSNFQWQTDPQPKLSLKNFYVNEGNALDYSSNMLVIPQCGLFWLHLFMRTDNTSECDITVVGSARIPMYKVLKVNVTLNARYDSCSRNDLVWLPSRSQLYLSSPTKPIVALSWSGFNLATLMDSLIAFHVYSNITISSPTSPLPFPFSNVALNEGKSWNSSSFKFAAPTDGIYVFGYSTAGTAYLTTSFKLVIDGNVLYNADLTCTNLPGLDVTSRSVVVSLKQRQSVWITGNGLQSYSDTYMLSSFKGFRYSPQHGIRVAWSVHANISFHGTASVPIPLNITSLNEGNAWNGSVVIISVSGYYYLSITATQNPIGGFVMYIYHNNAQVMSMMKSFNSSTNLVTREGSVIRYCVIGDILRAVLTSGTIQNYTSFSGFLLYPSTF